MNILFEVPSDSIIRLMDNLLERLEIDNAHVIMAPGVDQNKLTSCRSFGKIKNVFQYLDVFYDEYEKYSCFINAYPVDDEILRKMAPYEAEILKQLERNPKTRESIEKRFSFYFDYVKYWNYFLDKEKIGCFVGTCIPHECYDMVVYRLCQIKEIPIVMAERLPIQSSMRYILINDYEEFDQNLIQSINNKMSSGEDVVLQGDLNDEFELFTTTKKRQMPYKPEYSANFVARSKNLFEKFKELGLIDGFSWVHSRIQFKKQRKKAKNELIKSYSGISQEADFSKKYIYFPLQYQPEMTTSPLGGEFVHQYLAIEMLSYCVPDDVYIYVKEHPVILTYSSSSREVLHYERIKKLRNVKMIETNTSTLELMNHALAVSSITGSVGYEGMYKYKPFIMFGNQIMKYGPWTYNVRTVSDCKKALKEIVEVDYSEKERNIKAFLKTLEEQSFTVDKEGFDIWADTTHTVENATKAYMNMLIKLGAKERSIS